MYGIIGEYKVFDPPSTSLPFVAPSSSSTLVDTTIGPSASLASLLPLAQCMELEMGEPSSGATSVTEDDSRARSKEPILIEPYLRRVLLSAYVVMMSWLVLLLELDLSTLFVHSHLT